MAFKCEICKERDARRQFIGSVLNGEPEKELYICDECFDKLTPSLTWKSLGPLLTLQRGLLKSSLSLKSVVSTVLASAILRIHDKIENKLLKSMPDIYKREMTIVAYLPNRRGKGKREIHSLTFCKPYMEGTVKAFPFVFDGDLVNVFMSLDPDNEKNLINLVIPVTKEYFSPAFNYIGLGIDEGLFSVVEFFDSMVCAVNLIEKFDEEEREDDEDIGKTELEKTSGAKKKPKKISYDEPLGGKPKKKRQSKKTAGKKDDEDAKVQKRARKSAGLSAKKKNGGGKGKNENT